MGLLIVVGVAALVYAMATRGGGEARLPDIDKAALVRLGLPEGTELRAVTAVDRGVALHLVVPGKGHWVYIVPTSGDGRVVKLAVSARD
jgi:hypothetical protein